MDINLNNKNLDFKKYFHTILNESVESFIIELNQTFDTFLFSGILRNYFLGIYEYPRDLDIIIRNKEHSEYLIAILQKYGNYYINSFGGYKLIIGGLPIDIWFVENTWAIKNNIININHYKSFEIAILNSTFFNFSSILYDFKKNKFIYNSIFENFIINKEIDIVLVNNPSEALCVINIIYYAKKYRLSLSKKTKFFFINKLKNYTEDYYDSVQIKHFGYILFNYKKLLTFKNMLEMTI